MRPDPLLQTSCCRLTLSSIAQRCNKILDFGSCCGTDVCHAITQLQHALLFRDLRFLRNQLINLVGNRISVPAVHGGSLQESLPSDSNEKQSMQLDPHIVIRLAICRYGVLFIGLLEIAGNFGKRLGRSAKVIRQIRGEFFPSGRRGWFCFLECLPLNA